MAGRRPLLIVIAGPNGAGKSTTAPSLLRDALQVTEFVNADAVAGGLSAFRPDSVAIPAGRAMLKRIRHLADAGEDFAFETTLASRTFAPWTRPSETQRLSCARALPLARKRRLGGDSRGCPCAARWAHRP